MRAFSITLFTGGSNLVSFVSPIPLYSSKPLCSRSFKLKFLLKLSEGNWTIPPTPAIKKKKNNNEDEEDTFYYRYASSAPQTPKPTNQKTSRGIAFVQFVSCIDASVVASEMHGKILNGRKLSASIAVDNGRAVKFIRKREYKDKSRCYECGEEEHLSYECSKNQLGPRERPPGGEKEEYDSGGERFEDDNWASMVDDGADLRLRLRAEAEVEEKRKKVVKKTGLTTINGQESTTDIQGVPFCKDS
ncbi:unnamed protein product [Malus baccata var. baccata]